MKIDFTTLIGKRILLKRFRSDYDTNEVFVLEVSPSNYVKFLYASGSISWERGDRYEWFEELRDNLICEISQNEVQELLEGIFKAGVAKGRFELETMGNKSES